MMLPAHSRRQGIQPSSINPSISLSSAFRSNTPDSPAYRSFKSRRRRWHRWLVPVLENWGPNLWSLVRVVVAVALITLVLFRWVWEVQVEFSVYRREWVKKEILSLEHPHIDLAATCFSPQALATAPALSSWNYSLSTGHSPLHVSLQSTLALTHEGDCFAFSDSIRPSPEVAVAKITYYHSYWRADLLPFGARQAWTLKTFLATQPLASSVFILWSNGDLARNSPALTELIRLYPRNIEIRRVDLNELARGTALEGRADLLGGAGARDHLAWIDGDLVRLLVLWKIGGVWADMDMLFVRDLHVLLEVEWVTQWDCYSRLPLRILSVALLLLISLHHQQTSLTSPSTALFSTSTASRPTSAPSSPYWRLPLLRTQPRPTGARPSTSKPFGDSSIRGSCPSRSCRGVWRTQGTVGQISGSRTRSKAIQGGGVGPSGPRAGRSS